ncbi:MAG: endonuclease III [Phycisphaerales bacterium]
MTAAKPRLDGIPFSLPRVTPKARQRAAQLLAALRKHYPHAHCELNYTNPHELLVATILSAQSTDVCVNKATPALFKAFPAPADYAKSSPAAIEPYIKTIGLFRNKAKSIHAAMKDVHERFGGNVPRTMDELLSLRGVGRKTAGVVLGNAFNINVGVVVDTHVERLSHRFGLVPPKTPIPKLEQKLMALFPREAWCDLSHLLIFHGRYCCKARMAQCSNHEICRTFGTSCELRISARKKPQKRATTP